MRLTVRVPEGEATLQAGYSHYSAVQRLAYYEDAEEQGRIIILPDKVQEQRICVERALDIKLMDWQVAYIWGNSSYFIPGRATGKTLAYIIRLCLSEGEPLHMYPNGKHRNLCDTYQGQWYYEIFRSYVRDAYEKLKLQGGVKLRKIYFSSTQANEDSNRR